MEVAVNCSPHGAGLAYSRPSRVNAEDQIRTVKGGGCSQQIQLRGGGDLAEYRKEWGEHPPTNKRAQNQKEYTENFWSETWG